MVPGVPPSASPAPRSTGLVGIVMLDTRFPRAPGDIGHPDTFDGRVIYRRVPGARVGLVARPKPPDEATADALVDAARALEKEGACVIGTSCGYLGALQARFQAAVSVPVVTSALLLLPLLREAHGPRARIGVLTLDSRALAASHFGAAWDPDVIIEGMELSRVFYPTIAEDRPSFDAAVASGEVALATQRLRTQAGGKLDAVVLECTNLGPFRQRVRSEAGAPVYDLAMALRWLITGPIMLRHASA
ncbi:aspartate/glutamate racemase family protein [Rhodospira trueperi]|nr:aspartate/glutamate racemase family protein [Rhodospira trueperi]